MRVLEVTLSAFGSYGGEVVFPMEELGREGLFLISGDTGSGKTTLFDGICYALYGTGSGSSREGGGFACRYGRGKSFVSMRFALGEKTYEIYRGVGLEKATKEEAAWLSGDDFATVMGAREVTAEVERLLSLTVGQFRQIAMLAQGEFRDILLTSSKDRTEIFQKLFLTEKYGRLTARLEEDRKEIEGEIQEKEQFFAQKQSEIAWGTDEIPEEFSLSLLEDLISAQELDSGTFEARWKDLQEKSREFGEYFRDLELFQGYLSKQKVIEEKLVTGRKVLAEREEAFLAVGTYPEEMTAFEVENGTLEREKEESSRYSAMKGEISACETLISALKAKEEKAVAELAVLDGVLLDLEEGLAQGEDLGVELEKARQTLKELQGKGETVTKLEEIFHEVGEISEKILSKQTDYQKKWTKYQDFAKEYEEGMGAHLRFQAGFLAENLAEGEACPVCGALEHPQKAEKPPEAVLSREALETLKKKVDSAMKDSQIASEEAKILVEQEKFLSKQGAELGAELFEGAEDIVLAMAEWRSLALLDQAFLRLTDLEGDLAKRQDDLVFYETQKDLRKEKEADLGQIRLDFVAEESKGGELQRQLASLGEVCDLQEIQGKIDENLAKIRLKKKEYEKKKGDLDLAKGDLQYLLGQEKEESPVTVDVSLAEENREKLAEIQAKEGEIDGARQDLHHYIETNQKILSSLRETGEALDRVKKRGEWMVPLAQMAKGSYPKTLNLSLETFVQQRYFDRALGEANEILRQICPNTYELSRDMEKKRTAKVGLDINIHDLQTGTQRRASTLSGGESFQAALALALGFSKVVQRESACVAIESLFVDEGFGSLDETALGQAVEMLLNLGESGRIVGVISHVSGLKERIEKQILVEKSLGGSEISFAL